MEGLPSRLNDTSFLSLPSVESPAGARPSPQTGKMVVRFLDADRFEDRAEWLELWDEWPDREIMAHPDYARLFARPKDRVVAALGRTARGGILYPVILRPLAQEPWVQDDGGACDLTSPYGYGGPFAWGVSPAEAADFWKRFDAWAAARRVVSAFARLSLFSGSLLPWNGHLSVRGPNVVRSLDLSDQELWADYSYKVRQNVQRARRMGIRVAIDHTGKRLDEFIAVYLTTMKRRAAADSYFFPRTFFESICSDLEKHFVFFHVILGTEIIASEIVLLSENHAYSYLGGSLPAAMELRANELLKHESFLWCRAAGKKSIILGGGYKGEDGILHYKRTFASSGELPFTVGMKTYDEDAAERLVRQRAAWEASRASGWQPQPSFFPRYRS